MNSFEETITAAKRRHRTTFALITVIVFLLAMIIGMFIGYSRGVAINVLPHEAAGQSNVSIVQGAALATGGSVYGFGTAVEIAVSSPGFRTANRVLTEDVLGRSLTIELSPLPGVLTASTSPEGEDTRWLIDGSTKFVGTRFTTELEAGEYTIGIDNPFYEPADAVVSIGRGEESTISLALDTFDGTLLINSVPAGARVFVKGENLGETPINVKRPGGVHEIELQADNYDPKFEEIRITNTARQLERTYHLAPLSGAVTVNVTPSGGTLLVNGRKVSPGQRQTLSVGQAHTVHYEKPGYYPYRESLLVEASDERTIAVKLEPALGSVVFRSDPAAEVVIDGKARGQTPLTLDLPARKTTMTFSLEGYRSFQRSFEPKAGQQMTISHKMLTEREARIAEAPRTYANDVGMAFKLFGPAGFTMGAPRDQRGQRANEFLRDVRLTRHFYAGLHEVTSEQFGQFRPGAPQTAGPQHPIVQIAWIDAAAFSNWLSDKEGLEPFYILRDGKYRGTNLDADGYRLLTEAEWEWLARRAGRKETVVFPWGNTTTIPKQAGNIADENAQGTADRFVSNYNDGFARAAPVGSFPAEPSGLFDLAGNVSEWVNDLYSLEPPVEGTVYEDPMGGVAGQVHTFKGASFMSGDRTTLRPSYREGFVGGRDDLGFRVGRYLYGANNARN